MTFQSTDVSISDSVVSRISNVLDTACCFVKQKNIHWRGKSCNKYSIFTTTIAEFYFVHDSTALFALLDYQESKRIETSCVTQTVII